MKAADWHGLYGEGWGDEIVPDSFAHPAKFARGLIRKIYDHLIVNGYLKPGDVVADPFGGVGLGALEAMRLGCHWIGLELEQKFVDFGNQNIDRWNTRYCTLPGWGSAVLLQGDSRELWKVIAEAGAVVTSPPYVSGGHHDGVFNTWDGQIGENNSPAWSRLAKNSEDNGYGSHPANIGNMPEGDLSAVVTSPPYNLPMSQDHSGRGGGDRGTTPSEPGAFARYGNTPGQLEGLPMSEEGLQAVITSPPFGLAQSGGGLAKPDAVYAPDGHKFGDNHGYQNQGTTPGNLATMDTTAAGLQAVVTSPPYSQGTVHGNGGIAKDKLTGNTPGRHSQVHTMSDYGSSTGQLSAMPEGDVDAVVTSPPYAAGCAHTGGDTKMTSGQGGPIVFVDYGETPGQLANDEPADFWHAARQIVDECYRALAPGAVAVWVVKRFVRDKQIVPFPDQWRQMCEAAGFETVEWIRAWVVEDHGTQLDLWGNGHSKKVERKSFFRRLYESKNPQNAIDWEDVLIQRKV